MVVAPGSDVFLMLPTGALTLLDVAVPDSTAPWVKEFTSEEYRSWLATAETNGFPLLAP